VTAGHVPGHLGQPVPDRAGRTPHPPVGVSRPDVPVFLVCLQAAAQILAALDSGLRATQGLEPFSGTPKDGIL
jgi:hypothetical protein